MKDLTVGKAVVASLIILATGATTGSAQSLFFGMMSEQTPTFYDRQVRQEVTKEQAKEMFRHIDLNEDGIVTKKEFSASYPDLFPDDTEGKLIDKRFREFDMKKNGRITVKEFVARRVTASDEDYAMKDADSGVNAGQ